MDYTIRAFDANTNSIVVEFNCLGNDTSLNLRLPILEEGLLPTGNVLTNFVTTVLQDYTDTITRNSSVTNQSDIQSLVVPLTVNVLTTDQISNNLATQARNDRQSLLAKTDWVLATDSKVSDALKSQWITYRQSLRDITTQTGFPTNISWPIPPGPITKGSKNFVDVVTGQSTSSNNWASLKKQYNV